MTDQCVYIQTRFTAQHKNIEEWKFGMRVLLCSFVVVGFCLTVSLSLLTLKINTIDVWLIESLSQTTYANQKMTTVTMTTTTKSKNSDFSVEGLLHTPLHHTYVLYFNIAASPLLCGTTMILQARGVIRIDDVKSDEHNMCTIQTYIESDEMMLCDGCVMVVCWLHVVLSCTTIGVSAGGE